MLRLRGVLSSDSLSELLRCRIALSTTAEPSSRISVKIDRLAARAAAAELNADVVGSAPSGMR